MIFKITWANQIKALKYLLITSLIILMGEIYVDFEIHQSIALLVLWALYSLPAIYLHIEYVIFNSGEYIDFTNDGLSLKRKGNPLQKYNKEDLEGIVFYNTRVLEPNFWQVAPMNSYYYVRISVKSGSNIFITCLMSQQFQAALDMMQGVPYKNKYTIFASILFPITV